MLSESVLLYSAVPDTAEPGRSDRHESGPDPAVHWHVACCTGGRNESERLPERPQASRIARLSALAPGFPSSIRVKTSNRQNASWRRRSKGGGRR